MVNEVEVISRTVNSVGGASGSLITEERDNNTCSLIHFVIHEHAAMIHNKI